MQHQGREKLGEDARGQIMVNVREDRTWSKAPTQSAQMIAKREPSCVFARSRWARAPVPNLPHSPTICGATAFLSPSMSCCAKDFPIRRLVIQPAATPQTSPLRFFQGRQARQEHGVCNLLREITLGHITFSEVSVRSTTAVFVAGATKTTGHAAPNQQKSCSKDLTFAEWGHGRWLERVVGS